MEGKINLTHSVTPISRLSAAPREGDLELSKQVFVYLKKYIKHGYDINTQPLTINMEYEKVELKMDFGNQYSYFKEEKYDRFPKHIFGELDLNIFVDAYNVNEKLKGISIKWLFSVVGSTPTKWFFKETDISADIYLWG